MLNVAANWVWIPRYALAGAAWSSVAAYGVAVVINAAFAARIERGLAAEGRAA